MIKYLMHKDVVVAQIDCNDFYVKSFNVINDLYMPFRLSEDKKKNNTTFSEWKKQRIRPFRPQNFKNPIFKTFNKSFEEISKEICASLTDCYWFKPEGLNINWIDINYFDNKVIIENKDIVKLSDKMYKYTDCTDDLKKAFYSGQGYKRFIKYFTLNEDNNYCIVKANDILNNGLDVFNELVSNIVAESLDIDISQYFLLPHNVEFMGTKFSIPVISCELCIQDDKTELITANDLIRMNETTKENLYEYLVSLGLKEDINKMIVMDYLLLNDDRDLDNISLVRNADDLTIISLSPLYDFGASFNYNNQTIYDDCSKPFMNRHSQQITLIDDFSFVNFDALYESIDYVDVVLSYSGLEENKKKEIVNTYSKRIDSLKEFVSKNLVCTCGVSKLKVAENIKRRFNVDEILKNTGIDPIQVQAMNCLFINYLTEEGRKEFNNFQTDNPNLRERFENFKKDTLLL